MFLNKGDYLRYIKEDILDVAIRDTNDFLDQMEVPIIDEVASYLTQRYDVVALFPTVLKWDISINNVAGDFVVLEANADHVVTDIHAINDLVRFEKYVYICIQVTTGAELITDGAYWTKLDKEYTLYTNLVGTTGSELITNATNWEKELATAPIREPLLVDKMVDIAVFRAYKAVKPRNMTEFRSFEKDEAIKYLMNAGNPRKNTNPDWALKTEENEKEDVLIAWGSNNKVNSGANIF